MPKWFMICRKLMPSTACFLLGYLVSVFSAHASLTANPSSPYALDGTKAFFAYNSGTISVDSAAGFQMFALTEDTNASRSKMLLFDLQASGITTSALIRVAVMIRNTGITPNEVVAIPIQAAQDGATGTPSDCNGTTCPAIQSGKNVSAVYTNNTTLRIGFYPKEACAHINGLGKTGTGCAGGAVVTPSAESVQYFPLRFIIGTVASDADQLPDNNNGLSALADQETVDVDVYFQDGAPTVSCPSMDSFYIPGDGQIFVNASKLIYGVSVSGGASVSKLVVLAKKGGFVSVSDADVRGDFDRTAVNGKMSGFSNTTDGSDNAYTMGLFVRNSAGIRSLFQSPDPAVVDSSSVYSSSCSFTHVQTSEILTFLPDKKCFIATSAFGDPAHPAVRMLRQFRNQVLNRSAIGRVVVAAYEENSPRWAEILDQYPALKPLVRRGLSPLIGLGWIALHPFSAIAVVIAVSICFVLIKRRTPTLL